MNKKLVATAMGLVLASGMSLANADVKLYGQLDLSIDATDVDGGEDDVNMGSNRSAVGVMGSEDLGNGLSAFFKTEWQTDIDDANFGPGTNEDDSTDWTGRDQYVGLKTEGFGKLTFGTMSTAYKSASARLDPMYRTRVQSRNVGLQSTLHKGKGEEGQGRATNTVRYDSPSWSGFGFNATYTLDNDKQEFGPGSPQNEDDNPYSAGILFDSGNYYAFASYITTDGSGDNDAWQVGGKYTWGDAAFWGMYEGDGGLITLRQYGSSEFSTGTGDALNSGSSDGADVWHVGASYAISNNVLSVDYGQGDEVDDPTVTNDDYTAWRVAAQHMFTKRTKVYLSYANQDADEDGEIDITTLGVRHNF